MAASVELQGVLEVLENSPRPGTMNVTELREWIAGRMVPLPDFATAQEQDANGVPCVWTDATDNEATSVVVYAHGGGWVCGGPWSHHNLTSHLSRATGGRVLSVDYRLAPEHRFPAALEDVLTAYRWVVDSGIAAPSHVVLAGDSAGGHLVALALLALRDSGGPAPAGAILIGAALDLTCSGQTWVTEADRDPLVDGGLVATGLGVLLGDEMDRADPSVSPLRAELAGLAPVLAIAGEREVLRSDSEDFVAKAQAAGVDASLRVWTDAFHVFPNAAGMIPEADQAIEHMATWITQHTG